MEYYTAIKKNEILHCCNMDEPRECQTEWSKSDREGEIQDGISYVWSLKINDTNELIYKSRRDTQRMNLWLPEGKDQEGIVREFGVDMYTLLYLKQITNKALLYSTGNSVPCHVTDGWEGSLGENGSMYMCGWVPSVFTWNYHTLLAGYTPIQSKKLKKKGSK